jgi:phosphatidylinositol phospholipase C delta
MVCDKLFAYTRVDLGYVINHAMFQRNGRSGYVLKPHALRTQDKSLLNKRTRHYLDITVRTHPVPRVSPSLMRVGSSR